MKANVAQIWQQISSSILGEASAPVVPVRDEQQELLDLVERARQDWMAAKVYFENVSDPDLVDHAIHTMDATQKRYMYLLRKAREGNVAVHWH